MSQDEHISINVWLAGRSYRIRILPSEEEAVRKAVKAADEKITDLRRHYAGKDDQDFVSMCLLMYAADNASQPFNHPAIESEIHHLLQKIEGAIKDKE